MVMDPTSKGLAGQLAIYAAVIGTILALLGGVYSIATSSANIERQLDRNCEYIQGIAIGLRAAEAQDTLDHNEIVRAFESLAAGTDIEPPVRGGVSDVLSLFPDVRC